MFLSLVLSYWLSFSKKVQTWIPEKTESDAKDEKKDDSKKETEVADKDKK